MGLTVRLVGPIRVLRGVPPAVIEIGSAKERRLLAALAAERPRLVTPDELVAALWGDHPPQRPAANVATLVSRLRSRLGPDVVLGDHHGYRLAGHPTVSVDLDHAEALVAEATRRLAGDAPGLAAAASARALELLGTDEPLLGEDDLPWAIATRRRAAALLRAARHRAADATLRLGDPATARRAASAALDADPYDETALRLLLGADDAAGESARAVAEYHEVRARLVAELGVEPSRPTREAYLAVLREGPREPARVPTRTQDPVAPAAADRPHAGDGAGPVGRDEELALLTARWDRASAGAAGCVLIVGEAGIGKTRLATELVRVAVATGARCASARCHPAERSLFLQPVVDALGDVLATLPAAELRAAGGQHARTLAALFGDLASALGVAGADAAVPDARRTYEAVGALLRAATADRPLLLVLDDLHDAGVATVELIGHVTRRARSARLLVVATVRSDEGADALDLLAGVGDRLDVGPLPASAVRELAERAGHGELAGEIGLRTRGHPLFVVEVLHGLAAGERGVPESLQAAVRARARRLGGDVEELLRAGAVLGSAVDPDLVGRLLGIEPAECARRCERARAAGLLVDAGRTWEFANDLIHEVLYATTPAPVRRSHHRRAADLPGASMETVGAHAAAIEDWPRAARALLVAGGDALRRGAVGDAAALLDRAVGAAERTGTADLLSRALLARARAREGLEAFGAAWDDLGAAVAAAREAGDRRLETVVLRQLGGDVAMALGRPVEESTARLREARRLARATGDHRHEADARARLAVLATHRLAFTDALAEGEAAVRAARAAGEDHALAIGLDGLKTALAYLGHVEELADVLERMEPLVRRADDRWYLHWILFEGAFAAVAAGRWDDARARIEEAVEANRRSGWSGHGAWFVAHLGWVARLQGDLSAALEYGREAVASTGRGAHGWWWPTAQASLASTLLEAGRPHEARAAARAALDGAGADAVAACRLRALAVLAEAETVLDRGARTPEPVLLEADRLLATVAAPAGSAWLLGADAYLSTARAWAARGRPERARDVVAPLVTAAGRHGWSPLVEAGERVAAVSPLPRPAVAAVPAVARPRRNGRATAASTLVPADRSDGGGRR